MTTENKSQEKEIVISENDKGEGEGKEVETETITIPKKDYDVLNQTLGSLKRENKDLKKPKVETIETPDKTAKPEDNRLAEKVEKMALRQAGISHEDDITLARNTAKKWNMDIDDVLADEDFKVKLERQQTARGNAVATTGIKGGAGASNAKLTPEYWIAKGTPPTPADVSDRKVRAKIVRAMMSNAKVGKKFYND